MSDIEQLINLIANVLQPNDKQLRKNAEDTLVQLRQSKPNQLIRAYLAIVENVSNKHDIRTFAASQMRLSLSDFTPTTYTNLWPKLPIETHAQIKQKLFQIVYREEQLTSKKQIADTIGQIAGSIILKNDDGWPQFKKNIWTLFQDNNINQSLAGFGILQSFFNYAPGHFKNNANDLYALFKTALNHENIKLKLSTLKCMCSYLEVMDMDKLSTFQQLTIPIYEAVYFILINDNHNQEGLEILSDMVEVNSKFFKKRFKQLSELCKKIFVIPKLESGVKRMVTELMLEFADRYPPMMRKKKDILSSIVEMIFTHMVEIQSKVTDEWKSPPEGYNDDMEDDDDFQTTRFGMSAIDRLVYCVGQAQMLPILSENIQKLLQDSDWRHQYTAIMALSQIGEHIEQIQKISSIMQMIGSYLKHENPMLRYAACHAIGQISDDMQPQFQQAYGTTLLPQIVDLLKDPIPRVVAHAASAMTNFLQTMHFEQIEGVYDNFMQLLLHHAQNGISLVKQSALCCISSVAQVAQIKFEKYFEKTVTILFAIFFNHSKKQYRLLKGQSIQTLTIIAQSIGGQLFKPVAQKLIQLMIKMQSSQFEQSDPQKSFLLAGWQRLCQVYGRDLAVYLDRVLPSLFTLVENVINSELNAANDTEQPVESSGKEQIMADTKTSEEKANTFETEQAEVAISMLNVFIEKLKQLYSPYVPKTVQLLCKIIKEHPNEDVKEEACKCLPNLISAVKGTNLEIATNMAKYFLKTLMTELEDQFQSEVIVTQIDTLKDIIQELQLPFLTSQELQQFTQKILKMLKTSDEKKNANSKFMNQGDVDDDQKQLIADEIKIEEEIQVSISELIGVLFKTHKDMTLPLANYIIKDIFPKVFDANQSQNMYKFGIFLIDDMVEFLGFEYIESHWNHFGQVLLKFSQEKGCVIRQAACYGLGIYGKSTPAKALKIQTITRWLEALIISAKIPKGSQKQKSYGNCRDNAIASIGKIIKAHGNLFDPKPYLNSWIHMLPIRHDKPQGKQQHEFLCDILLSSPSLLIEQGNNKVACWQKVLSLLAQINANPKITNDEIKTKTKTYINSLKSDQSFIHSTAQIWEGLTDKHKKQLTDLSK